MEGGVARTRGPRAVMRRAVGPVAAVLALILPVLPALREERPQPIPMRHACHVLRRLMQGCLLLVVLTTIQVSAAEPRRILLLHAFGHPYSPWSDMAGSFRAEIIKRS